MIIMKTIIKNFLVRNRGLVIAWGLVSLLLLVLYIDNRITLDNLDKRGEFVKGEIYNYYVDSKGYGVTHYSYMVNRKKYQYFTQIRRFKNCGEDSSCIGLKFQVRYLP